MTSDFMESIGSRGKTIIFQPRNLTVLVAVVLVFVLRWKYNLSFLYFILFFVVPISIYYLVLPLVARRRFPAFEKRIRMLQLQGRWEEALAFYKKHFFLRAFGPVPEMKKLLGQIYAFLFKWESARKAFDESLRAAGSSADPATVLGFAETCFQTGRDGEAEKALSSRAVRDIHLPQSAYYKIHLLLEDEKKRKSARNEFEIFQWDEEKDGPVKLLVLSEILAEEEKLESALETLKQVERKKLPPQLRPMARLLEGRILFLQGKKREAKKILDELSRDSPSGRHLIELEDFEEE